MKYLITAQAGQVPPELGVDVYRAAKAWMNAKLADGSLDFHYVFADLTGGLVIANADSHEEVLDRILDFPLYPFFQWEVDALCDWSHSYDKIIGLYQRLSG
jgi:muconolactone delta-isomerase